MDNWRPAGAGMVNYQWVEAVVLWTQDLEDQHLMDR